jgi:hypothetical protein
MLYKVGRRRRKKGAGHFRSSYANTTTLHSREEEEKTKNIICLFFFLFKCCKRKRERKMLDGPFLIFPCERLFWHRDPSPPDAKLPSALFFLFCADLSIDIYT